MSSALLAPLARAENPGGVTSTVTYIGTVEGRAWVRFAANITQTGRCASGGWENEFTWDPTTEMGKTWMTMFMAAYLSGKTVQASGNGTCTQMDANNATKKAENLSYVRAQ